MPNACVLLSANLMQTMHTAQPRFRHTDEDLWAGIAGGDEAAFEALYRRYEATALRIAGRICGPGLAEDAVQAAFFSVWRSRSSFDPALGSVRSWVLTVVRNRSIDTLRERRRSVQDVPEANLPETADSHLTEHEVFERETGAEVRRAVAGLPAAQRRVVELAFFGEYSHAEIASQLEVPLGTVKGRSRLALEKLPHRLAAYGGDALAGVMTPDYA